MALTWRQVVRELVYTLFQEYCKPAYSLLKTSVSGKSRNLNSSCIRKWRLFPVLWPFQRVHLLWVSVFVNRTAPLPPQYNNSHINAARCWALQRRLLLLKSGLHLTVKFLKVWLERTKTVRKTKRLLEILNIAHTDVRGEKHTPTRPVILLQIWKIIKRGKIVDST